MRVFFLMLAQVCADFGLSLSMCADPVYLLIFSSRLIPMIDVCTHFGSS
jgi:hypothetical protein